MERLSAVAKRIAADLALADPYVVQEALRRRAPGVLSIGFRVDELSRDQYDDLCDAVESELSRSKAEGTNTT
jgi:hypothetical protein